MGKIKDRLLSQAKSHFKAQRFDIDDCGIGEIYLRKLSQSSWESLQQMIVNPETLKPDGYKSIRFQSSLLAATLCESDGTLMFAKAEDLSSVIPREWIAPIAERSMKLNDIGAKEEDEDEVGNSDETASGSSPSVSPPYSEELSMS